MNGGLGLACALAGAALATLAACGSQGKVDLGGDGMQSGASASASYNSGPDAASSSPNCLQVYNSSGCSMPDAQAFADGAATDSAAVDGETLADAVATDAVTTNTCSQNSPRSCATGYICAFPASRPGDPGECVIDPSGPLGNSMCSKTDLNCYCGSICGFTDGGVAIPCQQLVAPIDASYSGPAAIFCE
jgi:hypothetical protein